LLLDWKFIFYSSISKIILDRPKPNKLKPKSQTINITRHPLYMTTDRERQLSHKHDASPKLPYMSYTPDKMTPRDWFYAYGWPHELVIPPLPLYTHALTLKLHTFYSNLALTLKVLTFYPNLTLYEHSFQKSFDMLLRTIKITSVK
jgi:hypothetical protein